jgi:CBS domain-containing protein
VTIKKITLFIFGGVAQMTGEPSKPKEEFRMAIAGPAMSFALSVIFGAIYWFSKRLGISLAVNAVSIYLAEINIVLGVFNLFPGFPLDGGRVLRSIIWHVTADLTKATKIASRVGEAFATFLILSGFLIIFEGSWINGIWLIFIGWFLHNAAQASYQSIVFENMLSGVKVSDIMTREIQIVDPSITLDHLVNEYFMRFRHSRFPVVSKDKVLGMITFHDIKEIPKEKWSEFKVEDVMVPVSDLEAISPEEKSIKALVKLGRENIGCLLVLDNNQKLAGLVTRVDVMRAIRIKSELEV